MWREIQCVPPIIQQRHNTRTFKADIMQLPRYIRFLPADMAYATQSTWLNSVAGSGLVPRGIRLPLYRLGGVRVGRANIFPHIRFLGRASVVISDNAMINVGVTIDNRAPVEIHENVHVGPEVYIGTSTHVLGGPDQRAGSVDFAPVVIRRGAWIGARSTILPGVTIGEGAVVAAGAVVRENCAPNALYGGVPARRIKSFDP